MKIEVQVQEKAVADLVRQRIAELFSNDSRYRETGVRELVRGIVDQAAVAAVTAARDSIAGELPSLAVEAVRREVREEIDKAAKRGMSALRKLFAGFDPNKLTTEQRTWLEKQIATTASDRSSPT